MKHSVVNTAPPEIQADALVVGVYQQTELPAATQAIDAATEGAISRLLEIGEFEGKPNETLAVHAPIGIKANQVVLVGLGKQGEVTQKIALQAAGSAAKALATKPRKSVAFLLDDSWDDELRIAAIVGAMCGCIGQDLYRAEKSTHPIDQAMWPTSFESSLGEGEALGDSVNLTRFLVNEPPHALYPESFAEHAEQMAKESGLEIEIWDESRLEKEGCGALLAVGKGSSRPPRLAIMRHKGGGINDGTLALVGKGVTFDSGGLSLKPNDGMKMMKADMAGAGAVVGAMRAIAMMKVPANVIGKLRWGQTWFSVFSAPAIKTTPRRVSKKRGHSTFLELGLC